MRFKIRGFTLLELMIVVAIIGILASIALPIYKTYIYRAKAADVIVVLDRIKTVIAQFQSEKGAIGVGFCASNALPNPNNLALKYTTFKPIAVGYIDGISKNEFFLDAMNLKISFISCQSSLKEGQYMVVLIPIHKNNDTDARQVALAVKEIMQKQVYKSMVTSQGGVILTIQL